MGWCFRDPSLQSALVRRPCQRLVGSRLPVAIGGLRRRNAVPSFAAPCGHFASLVRSSSTARLPSESFALLRRIWRPVQHHRHPSRSSAWFKAAHCAALELRDKEFARKFQVQSAKVAFKQKLVPRVTRVAHVPRRRKIQARSPVQGSPGGAASPLPDSPPYGQRGRCPSLCETRGHCSVTHYCQTSPKNAHNLKFMV